MKNKLKGVLVAAVILLSMPYANAQNVSINMLVLNSGVIPLDGNGTLQATINATTGTAGQSSPVAAGKINVQITVPPSIIISSTQNNIPAGWSIRNNNGSVINLCNSSSTVAVNTAVNLQIDLQGVSSTTGSPTISGQISFRTNCSAPGSLSGDNASDNSSQAGFTVTGTVPVKLTTFTAIITNCQPVLNWTTENETNSDRFEIERLPENSNEWHSAGFVEAKGNNSPKATYNFIDQTAGNSSQTMMYRLKMIDKNGLYTYSRILSVRINCKSTGVTVYPNPVQDGRLQISFNGNNSAAQAILLSYSGQAVLDTKLKTGSTFLNVSHLANGVYILYVLDKDGYADKTKVLIQK